MVFGKCPLSANSTNVPDAHSSSTFLSCWFHDWVFKIVQARDINSLLMASGTGQVPFHELDSKVKLATHLVLATKERPTGVGSPKQLRRALPLCAQGPAQTWVHKRRRNDDEVGENDWDDYRKPSNHIFLWWSHYRKSPDYLSRRQWAHMVIVQKNKFITIVGKMH
jgi:hypothetical protein